MSRWVQFYAEVDRSPRSGGSRHRADRRGDTTRTGRAASLSLHESLAVRATIRVGLAAMAAVLVSVVIAVQAVLFLREAVAWEVGRDLPTLAVVIAALTLFLTKYVGEKR